MGATRRPSAGIAVAAAAVAWFSALPYAGGANDGSRLATAECLADYGTFQIDRSVFVVVPPAEEGKPGPYKPGAAEAAGGTVDKMLVGGHFYSDKPPVLSAYMAGVYSALQCLTGLTARDRPDLFCKAMTFATAGLAYVAAVLCVWHLFGRVKLSLPRRLTVTGLFAVGTLALPYMRNVNNHAVLLAVAAALFLCLDVLADGRRRAGVVLAAGALAGCGYTLDVAAGGPLLAAGAVVLYRTRSATAAALFAAAAAPWLAAHHALTYAVAGTLGPPGTVPEYFRWPGSPFSESNLTGVWRNRGLPAFALYAGELLVGWRRGFLLFNPPLVLVLPALYVLWRVRRRLREWPEVLLAVGSAAVAVLLYVLLSTDYSGRATSVRWFVPLLAAGFYLIAVAARYAPALLDRLGVLAGWCLVCGVMLWFQAAWVEHSVSLLWIAGLLGMAHWAADRLLMRPKVVEPAAAMARAA